MNRRAYLSAMAVVGTFALLTACGETGTWNPFAEKKPFVATPVPDDFAIIVDQDFSTYYSRQHMQQVITQQDKMSHAKYASFRDFNNTVSDAYEAHQPLLPEQLQAMWNEVSRNDLLTGGTLWMNWLSEADIYRLNRNTVQIRANGRVKTYSASNGYPPTMQPLIRQTDSVRLSTGQVGAPVVPGPNSVPPATPAAPESRPSLEDAVGPATTAPAATVPAATQPTTSPAPGTPGM